MAIVQDRMQFSEMEFKAYTASLWFWRCSWFTHLHNLSELCLVIKAICQSLPHNSPHTYHWKTVIILICSSCFHRTILMAYVLKLCGGNDTCTNDLLLSITFADQQLGVGAGTEWSCQLILFYSARCQHISKINKARKNRKNCMVGEIAPAFGKGWEMHSDIKSLYFISYVLSCIRRVGNCISDWRLYCQSGESRWKLDFMTNEYISTCDYLCKGK